MRPPTPTVRTAPPEKPASVRVVEQNPDFCCATIDRVVALVWNHPPETAALEEALGLVGALGAEIPGGAGLLVVLRVRGGPGDAALFGNRAAARLELSRGAILAVATVIGGDGLFALIDRLPLQLGSRLARGHQRCFGRPDQASRWLGLMLERAGTPAPVALGEAVDWLLGFYSPALPILPSA